MGSPSDSRWAKAARRRGWGRFFLAIAAALAVLTVVWLTGAIASSGIWLEVMLVILGPWDLLALCVAVGSVTYLVRSRGAGRTTPAQGGEPIA